jgi:hypothetical protein
MTSGCQARIPNSRSRSADGAGVGHAPWATGVRSIITRPPQPAIPHGPAGDGATYDARRRVTLAPETRPPGVVPILRPSGGDRSRTDERPPGGSDGRWSRRRQRLRRASDRGGADARSLGGHPLASPEPSRRQMAHRPVSLDTAAAGAGSHASHAVGRRGPAPRADRAGLVARPGRQGLGPSPSSDPQGGRANNRGAATLGVSRLGSTASTGNGYGRGGELGGGFAGVFRRALTNALDSRHPR